MSDILDDLKMMADHCDQENGDEPCDLGMLLIRAIAEIRNLRQQPVGEVDAVDGIPVPTGHAEADRLIGRLMSSDPDYDDCADAAALIQREIKGPDGFDTWREAALAERIKRTQQPVSAAEVPMPIPTEYQGAKVGTEWGGEAYSAGYFDGEAAGYARGMRDAIPTGHWVAPMEPTSDMKSAGLDVLVGEDSSVLTWEEAAAIYREMRDAALRGEVKP